MVLTGNEIYINIKNENIKISPFNYSQINNNSYDICLGDKISFYEDGAMLDPCGENNLKEVTIGDDGYILKKDKLYIAESLESLSTEKFVPILHTKSGIARMGIFSHITADLLSLGTSGKVTFT